MDAQQFYAGKRTDQIHIKSQGQGIGNLTNIKHERHRTKNRHFIMDLIKILMKRKHDMVREREGKKRRKRDAPEKGKNPQISHTALQAARVELTGREKVVAYSQEIAVSSLIQSVLM